MIKTLFKLVLVTMLLNLTPLAQAMNYYLPPQIYYPAYDYVPSSEQGRADTKCRYFNGKRGSCRYGDKCRFTHDMGDFVQNNHSAHFFSAPVDNKTNKETPEEYAARKERLAQKKRLDKTRNYAKSLGVDTDTYTTINELEREIGNAKKERKLEKTREYAKRLGIDADDFSSIYSLENEIQRVKQERQEYRQQRRETYVERGSRFSSSGYRIGSSSDPEAARIIVENMQIRRAAGERPSYRDCLEERHAAETLNPTPYRPEWHD